MDIHEIWRSFEKDSHAEAHAAEAVAVAVLALTFLLPITGSLVVADLGSGALRGRAEWELAAWIALVLGGPLLLHPVFRRLGGRARFAPSITALYGLFVAYCVAGLIARSTAPELARWTSAGLIVAAGWLLYRQLLSLHHLAPRRAKLALAPALALWVGVPALIARALPGAMVDNVNGFGVRLTPDPIRSLSWPAQPQPGSGGPLDAGPGYAAADALVVGFSTGMPIVSQAYKAVNAPDWSDARGDFARLVALNAPALAAFRRAAALPFCDLDGGVKTITFDTSFPNRFHPMRLSRLALMEARREQSLGHYSKAVDDYIAALSMARHFALQRNHRYMAAMYYRNIVESAYPGLARLVLDDKASAADDKRLLAALRRLQADKPGFGTAVADEMNRLALQSDAMAPVEASLLGEAFKPDFLDTRRALYALQARVVIQSAERNRPEETVAFTDSVRREFSEKAKSAVPEWYPNSVCLEDPKTAGRCWAEMNLRYAMPYASAISQYYVFDAALGALTASAAARVYQRKHGRLPKALDALVPEYLDAVPADPFDDFHPMRAAVEPGSWTVYSVGPDRVDDGARVRYEWNAPLERRWSYDAKRPPKGDIALRLDAR